MSETNRADQEIAEGMVKSPMDFLFAHIEHHPENGVAPWVVIIPSGNSRIWVAHETEAEAKSYLERKQTERA